MNTPSNHIIAHRGESFDFPENTISAIKAAWQRGVKAVEIDVHLTVDNEIVVIHDNHTGRVGDKKLVVRKSFLKELKSIDVGFRKAPAFKGESIPTLGEVLLTIPENGKLIIEIKCGLEIISPLVQLLKDTKLANHRIEFISFNLEVISEIKNIFPQYKALCLLDLDYYWPYWLLRINSQKIIKTIKAKNLDGVDVWAGKVLNNDFVKAIKDAGLLLYVWTVNDPEIAKHLLEYGIDAITTDRAEWLTKQLEAR